MDNKTKKKQEEKKTKKFKEDYYTYYDDIKSHTHDVYDWWKISIFCKIMLTKLKYCVRIHKE